MILIKDKIVIYIFFLALVSAFFWSQDNFNQPIVKSSDAYQYNCIASDLLNKGTFTECGRETNLEPLYPFFLASIYYFTGINPNIIIIVQFFTFAFSCVFIYLLSRNLFGTKVGIISAFISAVGWLLANYTGVLYRETLLIFLSVSFVYFLQKAISEGRNKFFILSGIILGLFSLTNSIVSYFLLFAIVNFIFVLRKRITAKELVLKVALFVFSFILVLSPWMIRNKIHSGTSSVELAPKTGYILTIRANFMERLYPQMPKYFLGHLIGYYFIEKKDPSFNSTAFRDFSQVKEGYNNLLDQGYNVVEADGIMKDKALSYISSNLHKYLLMSLLDFINFNSPLFPQRFVGGNDYVHFMFAGGRHENIPDYIKIFILFSIRIFWYTFLSLVLLGIFTNIKKWNTIGWLLLMIVYFNGVYSAVHAQPRYCAQIYPYYLILAVVGGIYLYRKIGRSQVN